MDEMKTTVRTLTFSTNYGCVCVQKGVAVCVGRAWTHHLACQPSVCLYCDTCLVVFVYRKVLLCVSVELEHITSPVSRVCVYTVTHVCLCLCTERCCCVCRSSWNTSLRLSAERSNTRLTSSLFMLVYILCETEKLDPFHLSITFANTVWF